MEGWLQAAAASIIGALVTAVTYLFKENQKINKAEAECRERLASMRSEIVSLNALVEQMQWSGSNRLEAIIVADMTTNYIIEWNPGATILLHWTEREMLGKPISKVIPQRYRTAHEEAVRKVVGSGNTPKRGPIIGHALNKDGVEVPVEIMLSGWKSGSSAIIAAAIRRRIETGDSSDGSNTAR